jgi:7,8-dihydropterin-6-yl-methyl-4-(beta-D-ribofuranosyl)aminobenzene 5'-phosphate synthase
VINNGDSRLLLDDCFYLSGEVLGGLHLAGAAMERLIPDTMAHLGQFALAQIMPVHCTGWRALWALLNAFGESVVTPCAVGSRFTF